MRFTLRGTRPLLVLGLVALAQMSCTRARPVADPGLEPGLVPDEVARLELGDALAGRTVSRRASGGWSYRSTAGGGGGGGGGEAVSFGSKVVARSTARPGGGGAPAKKPAPPTGATPDPGAAPEGESDSWADASEPMDARGEVKDLVGDRALDREESASKRPHGVSAAPARALKAGSTDDNEAYDEYLAFLDHWAGQQGIAGLYQPLDVRDRRYVRVVDASGRPVPAARVAVVDELADRVVLDGTTYGDGRVPFYPHVLSASAGDEIADSAHYHVEARVGDQRTRVRWDGSGDELVLRLDDDVATPQTLALDVVLLIDTTGSMGDEIASIKAALLRMTEQLRALDREFDLRYGAVLYRDIGDEYLTAKHPFTSDVEEFDQALRSVQARGGGDGPESLNQGLAEAVGGVAWRADAAKLVFLIADAPPHMDYPGDVWYGESLAAAVSRGVKVHAVAASGLDPRGTLVFRQIAQYTRGKFIFIEYGGHAASKASHGVTGPTKSNNLEDILFEQIRDELAHWGRDS